MKVAVVTPYYKESEAVLRQCHESVLAQNAPCDHFLIADGHPKAVVDTWRAAHFKLPFAHADNGNAPRVFGGLSAFNLGYAAVAFLDADNWYREDHVEQMVRLAEATGAAVCTSNRSMHRPDGSYMFDDDMNDGKSHVDTSCLFLSRRTMPTMARWSMMPKQLGPVCDTVYFSTLKTARLTRAHDLEPTVRFRTTYEADFVRLGEPNPDGVKTIPMTMRSYHWWRAQPLTVRRRIRHELGWPPSIVSRTVRRIVAFARPGETPWLDAAQANRPSSVGQRYLGDNTPIR